MRLFIVFFVAGTALGLPVTWLAWDGSLQGVVPALLEGGKAVLSLAGLLGFLFCLLGGLSGGRDDFDYFTYANWNEQNERNRRR